MTLLDRMLQIKFILIGGEIISNDLDVHYISSEKLAKLYDLPLNQCEFADEELPTRSYKTKDLVNPYQIILYPRDFGDYKEHLRLLFNIWSSLYGA